MGQINGVASVFDFDASPTMPQQITLQRPDGQALPVHVFEPAKPTGQQPGVVLLQEWWGVDASISEVAQRVADEGYTVLVPDLYRGRVTASPDEAGAMMNALDKHDAVTQDVAACVQWLQAQGRRAGVMGFCMGGALSVASAALVPGLAAAVCFYGIPPTELADPAHIGIPFLGHFASQDSWCTPELAEGLKARMAGAGRPAEIHFYPARHAFFNHRRPDVHDPAQAQLAWGRTQAFLKQHLA
jgi:carboxymethylenebutenolidase